MADARHRLSLEKAIYFLEAFGEKVRAGSDSTATDGALQELIDYLRHKHRTAGQLPNKTFCERVRARVSEIRASVAADVSARRMGPPHAAYDQTHFLGLLKDAESAMGDGETREALRRIQRSANGGLARSQAFADMAPDLLRLTRGSVADEDHPDALVHVFRYIIDVVIPQFDNGGEYFSRIDDLRKIEDIVIRHKSRHSAVGRDDGGATSDNSRHSAVGQDDGGATSDNYRHSAVGRDDGGATSDNYSHSAVGQDDGGAMSDSDNSSTHDMDDHAMHAAHAGASVDQYLYAEIIAPEKSTQRQGSQADLVDIFEHVGVSSDLCWIIRQFLDTKYREHVRIKAINMNPPRGEEHTDAMTEVQWVMLHFDRMWGSDSAEYDDLVEIRAVGSVPTLVLHTDRFPAFVHWTACIQTITTKLHQSFAEGRIVKAYALDIDKGGARPPIRKLCKTMKHDIEEILARGRLAPTYNQTTTDPICITVRYHEYEIIDFITRQQQRPTSTNSELYTEYEKGIWLADRFNEPYMTNARCYLKIPKNENLNRALVNIEMLFRTLLLYNVRIVAVELHRDGARNEWLQQRCANLIEKVQRFSTAYDHGSRYFFSSGIAYGDTYETNFEDVERNVNAKNAVLADGMNVRAVFDFEDVPLEKEHGIPQLIRDFLTINRQSCVVCCVVRGVEMYSSTEDSLTAIFKEFVDRLIPRLASTHEAAHEADPPSDFSPRKFKFYDFVK